EQHDRPDAPGRYGRRSASRAPRRRPAAREPSPQRHRRLPGWRQALGHRHGPPPSERDPDGSGPGAACISGLNSRPHGQSPPMKLNETMPGTSGQRLHVAEASVEARAAPRWALRTVLKVVELRLRFVALIAGTGLVFAYWDTLVNRVEKWR